MRKYILILMALLLTAARLSAQASLYVPGATYGGGVIIYMEPGGTWGLIAAKQPFTRPQGYTWHEADTLCQNLILGKKADWYLPSKDEVEYIDLWLGAGVLSDFTTIWTADSYDTELAWARNFTINFDGPLPWLKTNSNGPYGGKMAVRPIRRFFVPLTSTGDPGCLPPSQPQYVPGPAAVTCGGGINIKNNSRRMSLTVGQGVIGVGFDGSMSSCFGLLGDLLLTPSSPLVTATQGELLDRIQINWEPNPLGAQPTEGYKLYRDGIFLAALDLNVRNYNDFNVIAGKAYTYSVRGINSQGEGKPGIALGYQVPNGVVTGNIQTLNGSPVVDAIVSLSPMQGFSMKMDAGDLAFARDTLGFLHDASRWTLTSWFQVDQVTDLTRLLEFEGANWWLEPYYDGFKKGVVLNVQGGPNSVLMTFPDSTKNGWHHVAVSYDSTQFRGYVDGSYVGSIAAAALSGDTKTLNLGGQASKWSGRVDELRIYHKVLDELDMDEIMAGTGSSYTPGLKYYWKMDEEVGTKSFDIIGRNRLFFCGPEFDASRPPVRTAGKTDENGYYRIESASYGTGTTFIAKPSKLFYMHRSLKFVRDEQDYATLPDFGLTDSASLQSATIELWVNSAGPNGNQSLLSKKWGSNEFKLSLGQASSSNILNMSVNGSQQSFGILGQGYRHLAFKLQQTGSTLSVEGIVDGTSAGTRLFTLPAGNWSDTTQQWVVGATKNGAATTDHFGGLIDEIVVYDTLLSNLDILKHKNVGRDAQERHLRVYFAFDEGAGNRLNNTGARLTGGGQNNGAEWSAFAAIQKTEPHEFSPGSRQVTLNPSVTSVDHVDFTDRSTIAVTGYVRYVNTDCFAKQVEILVNGQSYNPAVYTDTTGRFVIDLDPGATVTLTPKFEDHQFIPAFWEVLNISSPIAGVLFNDMTTRKVSGVVAGGDCKFPIIGNGEICKVKIRSTDDCYEKTITVTDPGGAFEFTDLPPTEMTLAVTEFSNPVVYDAFQIQGGSTVDLAERDTLIDFIYHAPPEIIILSGFDPVSNDCDIVVFDQGDLVTMEISMAEKYGTEYCYLDTADFHILNGISGISVDTSMGGPTKKLVYKFRAGQSNPVYPHLQTLQIVATTVSGNEVSLTRQAVVTGIRYKENTFTTVTPATPKLILRDPPGDGSYSYWEKGETVCQTVSFTLQQEVGLGEEIELHFGLEAELIATVFGVGVSIPEKTNLDVGITAEGNFQFINDSSIQTCLTYNQRISTSEDELLVGGKQGGDVFVGNGINLEFGFADLVSFDETSCNATVTSVVNVEPTGFATSYIYSENYIRGYVIRYLDSLITSPDTPDKATYIDSKQRWEDILADNDEQKNNAKFLKNISFESGATYEYSETSDTVKTSTNGIVKNTFFSLTGKSGFQIGGVGVDITLGAHYAKTNGKVTEDGNASGVTTGYVLADNDVGDAFTVDIGMDTVYNTPVFTTKTGQSSCPWEPNTAHREGCLMSLRDGYGAVATDVPANEPAVYKFTLGNVSATNETFTYAFTAGPESNPDGAVIKLNGAVLDHPVYYAIPYGESIPITLTVERGPEAYDYNDLEVVLYSECEDIRASALGIAPDDDTITYSAIYISAHFIKPCSEVEISVPQQDWVIHPDSDPLTNEDVLKITLSGYNKTDPDLDVVRVQYRQVGGDGAWINIGDDIPKDSLGNIFKFHDWNTAGLIDGPYEIRAVALCNGDASDNPGYSHVIRGRIERQPPQVIGIPEPSDGVLNIGDEISVTFNKDLDCNKIFKADLTSPRNVGLYDATTNTLIDFNLYCFENRIELDPTFQNKYFENHVLRLELHNVPDKIGNKLDEFEWEFVVDRNELAWLSDSMGMTKTEDEIKSVTVNIHNRGGSNIPFSITGIPDWVHVVPSAGTLVANEIRPITFEVDSTLAFGRWSDTIVLHTETGQNPFFMGGDELLPIGVRVVCRPPDWDLDAGIYPVTMNMVLKLDIEGEFSLDVEDIVAAYIGDELRGRAHVMYVPQVDQYLAYLTIYGESTETNVPVNLQIWDASSCLRYGTVLETFTFQPDNVIGSPVAPQIVHTNNLVLREIPLSNGWNWISFNLAFDDPATGAALASLNHPENDLIKGQSAFSMYGGGWFGSLASLSNTTMYQFRADQPDTLKMMGHVINPLSVSVPLNNGWNWIGYLPTYALEVNEALGSLSPATGDLIKSQYGFSQYIDGFGWIGNLKYMQAPQGYQLRLTGPGALTYPSNTSFRPEKADDRGDPSGATYWTVDPTQFENSMTLVGMLVENDQNVTPAGSEIGVFSGDNLRGAAPAIYVEPLEAYLYFLTAYSNTAGEQMHFKTYNTETGLVENLSEVMYFAPDLHQGDIQNPVPFSRVTTGTEEAASAQFFTVHPNPFNGAALLQFTNAREEEVQVIVSDQRGREIDRFDVNAARGLNAVQWQPQIPAGVYFIRLKTGEGTAVCKVIRR